MGFNLNIYAESVLNRKQNTWPKYGDLLNARCKSKVFPVRVFNPEFRLQIQIQTDI